MTARFKVILSVLLMLGIGLTGLCVFLLPDDRLEAAGGTPVALPSLPELTELSENQVKAFFREFDDAYAKRLPINAAYGLRILNALNENINLPDVVIRGYDEWFYLGNNHARMLDKFTGKYVSSPEMEDMFFRFYTGLHDKLQAHGILYLHLICPNKMSVHPEYLPPFLIRSKPTFEAGLQARLRDYGIRIIDPTAYMLANKNGRNLYYKGDSHWNALGAYLACEYLLAEAGLPPLPECTFETTPIISRGYGLSKMIAAKLPDSHTCYRVKWSDPALQALVEQTYPDPIEWGLIEQITTSLDYATSDKTVWVIGDSFTAFHFHEYLDITFQHIEYVTFDELDEWLASERPKPDILLFAVVERNFLQ